MNSLVWNKNVELETGVIASYWVVKHISANMENLQVVVSYEGYLDQSAFAAGKAKLVEKSTVMTFSQTEAVGAVSAEILAKAQDALDLEYPA
jgi:hypothetical protein